MKRLLTLTLYLIATATPLKAVADQCDNLRNNQQAYRDCVNDWYGRSNRGSVPTPWWKNYDPNAGSNSAPAEAPQQYRPFAPRYVPPPNPNERAQLLANFDAEMKRVDALIEQGNHDLLAGKPKDASHAFAQANGIVRMYDGYRPGDTRSRLCQINENIAHAEVAIGEGDPEHFFKVSVRLQEEYAKQTFPLPKSDIAEYNRALNALATFYENQGRWNGAAELHQRRLQHTERSVGHDHPETLRAQQALNRVIKAKVKQEESYKLALAMNVALHREDYATVLKASEDLLVWAQKEGDDSLVSVAQHNQAKAQSKLDELQRQRAANLAATTQASDWKAPWNTLGDEAVKLSANRKLSLAIEKAQEALALAEKHDGPKQYAVASSQQLLAQMLWQNKQTDEAEALLKTAISTFEQSTESKTIPALSKTLTTLARLHAYQKRNAEAEPLYKRALALHEKQADPNLPALIESLTALENFYFHDMHNQRSAEYAAVLRRKLALQEKHLGPEHLDIAETLNSLASHLHLQGMNSKGAPSTAHYNESETHYKRALAILEKAPSAKAKRLLRNVFSGLRLVYRMTDRNQEAEQLEQREKALEAQS